MKNKIINITFASLLGASTVVLAEGDKHDDFLFTKQSLASLKLNSLLTIDDTQFVFNDSLLNEDWDNFFLYMRQQLKIKKSSFYTGQVIPVLIQK
ncbi:hypothetical protein [Pseudoalteromonas sp. RW-H-Ap-1]|uniref:hypothetical protein n=1 Tax=Pseudoalteromonas sp. RW-H-Ap-1 TaxID=3241171 RepID=UPI00390CC9DA|nr:hypothetical protein [Ningiella sp. W23]